MLALLTRALAARAPAMILGARPAPFAARAARGAALAITVVAAVAVGASLVRLLPWLLDGSVPWRVAAPFARGMAALASEASVLLGWPIGWSLALQRAAERGEWRALEALGESPLRAVARLAPQAAALALVVGASSFAASVAARDTGRVARALVREARSACASSLAPRAYAVPFVEVTWLCAPDWPPRVVARPRAGVIVTASEIDIATDMGAIRFTDALVASISRGATAPSAPDAPAEAPSAPSLELRAGVLVVRGALPLAPVPRLGTLPRAALVALSAAGVAFAAAYAALRGSTSRVVAIACPAAGALAVLALMRVGDARNWPPLAYVVAPLVGGLVPVLFLAVARRR